MCIRDKTEWIVPYVTSVPVVFRLQTANKKCMTRIYGSIRATLKFPEKNKKDKKLTDNCAVYAVARTIDRPFNVYRYITQICK